MNKGWDNPRSEGLDLGSSTEEQASRSDTEGQEERDRRLFELEQRISVVDHEMDLKDRLLASQQLEVERTAARLRQVLAAMSSAVLMIELDGYISEANPQARDLLGFQEEPPLLASEVLPESLQDILDEVIGEGRHVRIDNLAVNPHEESVLTVRVDCRLVQDDKGHPIGVLILLDDVTQIIRMERRLEQARTLAALGEMAASVAHELRNPLGGIGGFAALLKDMLPRESVEARYVSKIIEGVDGLNKVATNLLAYTRPVEPMLQDFDLCNLLREVISFVQIEIEQEGYPVRLLTELGAAPRDVQMDPELLRQGFLNLFKNAVQALGEQGGEVLCRVSDDENPGWIRVDIMDDGPGVAAELQEKLFNPFFTTRAKGTGLGLAIVRKNIELHGGQISLVSQAGEGATFTVQLPLAGKPALS